MEFLGAGSCSGARFWAQMDFGGMAGREVRYLDLSVRARGLVNCPIAIASDAGAFGPMGFS